MASHGPARAALRAAGPRARRAPPRAARRRDARATDADPGRPARRRGNPPKVAGGTPRRGPLPRWRASAGPVPSTHRRHDEAHRRRRAPPAHTRRRADAHCTRCTARQARPSEPRSARRGAAAGVGAPLYRPHRPGCRATRRSGSVAGEADRAHHDARAKGVPFLCQLGEYSLRSGRLTRRRIRLSASSNCVASPMSYHSPRKR